MTIKINGTNTTAQPSITGTDTDTGLVYGTDEVSIVTGGTDRVTVDGSGRLLVGTSAGSHPISVVSSQSSKIQFGQASDQGGFLFSDGPGAFGIAGGGYYNGTNWIAKHTTSSHIRDDGDGNIKFDTNTSLTAGSTFTPTERMRIQSGGGISFNGDSAAANALDDYEEGTWTGTSPVGTLVSSDGTYTKIGRMVFLRGKVGSFSDITNDAGIEIRGLPFAPSATNTDSTVGSVMYQYIDDTDGIGPDLVSYMTTLSVRFYFQSSDGDSNYAITKHKDLTSTSSFRFSIQYNVD